MDTQTNPSSNSDNLDPTQFTCLYFGFASNLSPRTLQQRCPGSLFVGLARLRGWKFIVTELGFGNIVPSESDDDVVYGSLYFLTKRHETAMDGAELIEVGDQEWHVKRKVKVKRIEVNSEGSIVEGEGEEVEATTYVDLNHTTPGTISKENLTFIRRAVDDGLRCGVPQAYFDRYWKQYLPEDESIGRQETMTMVRTIQMDKEDSRRYVPRDVLSLAQAGKQ